MANLRRSLVINFFSSSGIAFLQFIVSVVLARMLSPNEIGVYSMTVVFVNLAHVFRDFGVTSYLQREDNLTPDKIRSATGVVFTSSWVIASSLFLASPAIGRWFNEPAMVPVMRVLAIGFFFIPFGTITNALLARNFEAEKQAWINAIGTVSFCISCLGLAKLGYGSLSLAYANLTNIIVCGLASLPLRQKDLPWLPSFRRWRNVLHYGLGSLLSACAGSINNAIPDILLGKLGTARLVGLLSRANSTATIFSYIAGSTVSYGAVSYLAQTHHRGDSLAPVISRATLLLTGVGWTALALTVVLGQDVILTLYGPKWLECVPAILPLSLSAAVTMMFNYSWPASMAIGRPYLATIPTVVTLISRIILGIALFDGSLRQFAWALCLATITTSPVLSMQQSRYFGLNIGTLLRTLIPSALVATGTAATGALLSLLLPAALPPMARLLIMLLPLAAVWYILLKATRHELVGELHLLVSPLKARIALLRPNV